MNALVISSKIQHRRAALPPLLWSVVISAAFATTLFTSLSIRAADIVDTPLAVQNAGWPAVAVELFAEPSSDSRGGTARIRRATFTLDNVELLTRHAEIRILFATYFTR